MTSYSCRARVAPDDGPEAVSPAGFHILREQTFGSRVVSVVWSREDEPYEPTEEEIEHELNRSGPPTIKPPEPSKRADIVAAWLRDPAVMLADLTETLNQMLSHCHVRYFDRIVRELIPEQFHGWDTHLLSCLIEWGFLERVEQINIRNSIESTPFSPDVIHDVSRSFRACTNLRHQKEGVPLELAGQFTDAISHYELQLQILADWIEARAIFSGKKPPADPNGPKKRTATKTDVANALRIVIERGQTPDKETVGAVLRNELGRSIGTTLLFRMIMDLREKGGS